MPAWILLPALVSPAFCCRIERAALRVNDAEAMPRIQVHAT